MINCIEYTQKRIVLSCCIAAFVTFGPGLMCRATKADAEKPSWEMVKGDMVTRWAKEVSPTNAPLSHFGYGGMLTATALMGNIAARVKGKLLYDSKNLRFTNSEQANKLLTRNPRDGWYV